MTDTITPQSVRQRATAAHVSLNALLMRAGIPASTFWRWEVGRITTPHPVTLQKISDALDECEANHAAR